MRITDAQTGILDLNKLVKKLGDHAPSPIRKEEADQEINFSYARSVLSAAKSNAPLFSREEIGHILAADYLMQAISTGEDSEMPALGVDADEETPTLPKIDPKLDAALKVVAAVVKNSGSYQDWGWNAPLEARKIEMVKKPAPNIG